MKSAASNDDQAPSPAAERLRRRNNAMRTIILMVAAYKDTADVRQQRGSQRVVRNSWPRPDRIICLRLCGQASHASRLHSGARWNVDIG
jgi:hypothetical protein